MQQEPDPYEITTDWTDETPTDPGTYQLSLKPSQTSSGTPLFWFPFIELYKREDGELVFQHPKVARILKANKCIGAKWRKLL